jgi:asparagine synthase (glutamine-hydrolysing)
MCGITGLVNWGDRNILARMTGLLKHRGPDDFGIYDRLNSEGTWVGIGNRRLAILDLSAAGHMPMANDDSTLTITYNGEVYNSPELRRQLEIKGYRFRSRTDTEVVLKMYEEYGPECVEYFEGMFAFAVLDGRREELFLARDHFGVKPLYYICRDGRFAFASEIKAFLAIPDFHVRVCPESLQQYLTFLWVPEPATIFDGVLKLPAAHWAVFKQGELKIQQYWNHELPPDGSRFTVTEDEAVEALRAEFERSVRQQMLSDVPVGAFLSGGVDSSSIVSTMRLLKESRIRTYTISFPRTARVGENTLDDPRIAAELATSLGCEHHHIEIAPDVASLLPSLAYQMDEPVADPALLMTYLLCREAGKDVTVLLSGIGGDELFAGYRKYQAHYWSEMYRNLPAGIRRHVIEPAISALPTALGTRFQGPMRLAKKMARSAGHEPIDAALHNVTYMSEELRAELCKGGSEHDPWQVHRGHLDDVAHADFLNRLLYLDFKTFLVSLNLAYTDKMSMASSVEVRVPFLNRRLAEFAIREIAPSLKLKGRLRSTPKYILKKAMADRLPETVLRAPKAGFGAPIHHWLSQELRETVDDLLSPERLRSRGLFDPAVVHRLLNEHRAGRADWSYQLWQLLTFELWAQAFLDGKSTELSLASALADSEKFPAKSKEAHA